jgi:hypothetical protein
MRRNILAWTILVAASSMLPLAHANAEKFHAVLSGFEEVGPLNAETGAIFSGGNGTIDLDLNETLQMITYTLTYSGTFSSAVQRAHIHFGKRHVPGGIFVFFCTNLSDGPAGTPLCPSFPATVTGTWTPASVKAIAGQNVLNAGDFAALVAALESDTAYGNIHTVNFPSGEIRGQIRRPDNDKH